MEHVTLQHQQGLNQVVINKVHRMLENRQTGVRETMQRLVREGSVSQDYIAPIGMELRRKEYRPAITFGNEGELVMNMHGQPFKLHDNAIGQLAEKMNVPSPYLRELSKGDEWQRLAGADNSVPN